MRSLFLLPIIVFISACSNNSEHNNECVFRYNQPNTVTSLDPAFARNQSNIWAVDHIYNTLIQLDDSLHVQPCIASDWNIDSSGTIYHLTIRKDITFHDDDCFPNKKGRLLTVDDVIYSLNRIIDTTVASPGSWIFKGRVAENNPFSVVNDSVVEIRLIKPFMPFLQMLSMQYCCIVPKEAVQHYGKTFRQHPVGTGPFQMVRWIEGQTMILKKNPNYFEFINEKRLPYVDIVRISFIGDKKTAFLQLLEGNLDFLSGFDPSMASEIFTTNGTLRSRYSDKIQCYKAPYLNTEYLGINLDWPTDNFLHIKKFRQALNFGFDRQGLLETIRQGIGTPAISSFPPSGLPSYNPGEVQGYRYNPSRARQLLKESGYFNLPVEKRPILSLYTAKEYSDYCLYIAKQWEQLGVRCKVELAESATVREMMRNGKILFFRGSWLADYPDAENYLTVFYSKNPAPPNYTRFKNAEYDSLYEASLICKDEKERFQLYQRMEKILVEESPVIFLYYDAITNFTSPMIKDYMPNPLNLLKVKYIKKDCRNPIK